MGGTGSPSRWAMSAAASSEAPRPPRALKALLDQLRDRPMGGGAPSVQLEEAEAQWEALSVPNVEPLAAADVPPAASRRDGGAAAMAVVPVAVPAAATVGTRCGTVHVGVTKGGGAPSSSAEVPSPPQPPPPPAPPPPAADARGTCVSVPAGAGTAAVAAATANPAVLAGAAAAMPGLARVMAAARSPRALRRREEAAAVEERASTHVVRSQLEALQEEYARARSEEAEADSYLSADSTGRARGLGRGAAHRRSPGARPSLPAAW